MLKYELTLILRSNLKDKEQKKVIEELKKLIEKKKGKVEKVDFWGKRKLAYEIQKQKEGVYYFLSFEASPEVLVELEKKLKQEESVIRFLVVRTK